MIASRIGLVSPSMTIAVSDKATALKAAGKDVISLSMGELDCDTPEPIKEAAIKAIKDGKTKYTPVSGIATLKEAIAQKLKLDNGLEYQTGQVIVGTGAKQVLFNVMAASINPGDEVIIPAPYWVSYIDMVAIFEGKPVVVEHNRTFTIDIKAIEKAITPKTKWLILNFPNNPAGSCISHDELKELSEMLLRHPHVHILSDDIYEYIVFDGNKFYNIATVNPKLKDRVFIVNGVSKGYSMTGWRIGYGVGNADLIEAMSTVQSQSTSSPSSISQYASLAAISSKNANGHPVIMADNISKLQDKRDFSFERLKNIKGLDVSVKPSGAFYIFPSIAKLIGKKTKSGIIIHNDEDFANYLIGEHLVAVVPGSAFGVKDHFRISYAASESLLKKAFDRLEEACQQLG